MAAISYAEFQKAMSTLGLTVSAEVEELWKSFDKDGTGEIVYHELLESLTPSLAPAKPSFCPALRPSPAAVRARCLSLCAETRRVLS